MLKNLMSKIKNKHKMKKRKFEMKDFLFLAAVIIPFVILMLFAKFF